MIWRRDEAKALTDRALSFSKAEETFVSLNGGERANIRLWGGMVADFSVPFLMILAFLAGLLPMLLAYHALKWQMRQRLSGLERALSDLRAVQGEVVPIEPEPAAPPAPPLLSEAS